MEKREQADAIHTSSRVGPGLRSALEKLGIPVENRLLSRVRRTHAQSGLDLIRWGYSDYYTFRLADDATFNRDVRAYVLQSMSQLDPEALKSAD